MKSLHHEGERSSGLDVTVDEFREHVQTNLVVRDGLNDTDGQREAEGDDNSQEESPPAQVGRIREDSNEADAKHLEFRSVSDGKISALEHSQ